MRGFTLALVLSLVSVCSAFADRTPTAFQPGTGIPNPGARGEGSFWSEPPDLNGLIGSSEQILSLGLETELANDFVADVCYIFEATWWGGYFSNTTPCSPGIPTPGFNLRFYEDAGCVPGNIIADLPITHFTEEVVGCQAGMYPLFKWTANAGNVPVLIGNVYWFGAQMMDHAYPPQAGRLASMGVVGCESVFKSPYFGYPDWTHVSEAFGVAFDCSQEFREGVGAPRACCWPDGSCTVEDVAACSDFGGIVMNACSCDPNPCHPTPTKTTSWGSIKTWYR